MQVLGANVLLYLVWFVWDFINIWGNATFGMLLGLLVSAPTDSISDPHCPTTVKVVSNLKYFFFGGLEILN